MILNEAFQDLNLEKAAELFPFKTKRYLFSALKSSGLKLDAKQLKYDAYKNKSNEYQDLFKGYEFSLEDVNLEVFLVIKGSSLIITLREDSFRPIKTISIPILSPLSDVAQEIVNFTKNNKNLTYNMDNVSLSEEELKSEITPLIPRDFSFSVDKSLDRNNDKYEYQIAIQIDKLNFKTKKIIDIISDLFDDNVIKRIIGKDKINNITYDGSRSLYSAPLGIEMSTFLLSIIEDIYKIAQSHNLILKNIIVSQGYFRRGKITLARKMNNSNFLDKDKSTQSGESIYDVKRSIIEARSDYKNELNSLLNVFKEHEKRVIKRVFAPTFKRK